jgi:sedoheptulokinase
MAFFIGLDVGTTTLSTVVLDSQSGQLLAHQTTPHDAGIASPIDRARGRAELDLFRLRTLIIEALARIRTALGRDSRLCGLGVTGQMHGVALLGPDTTPRAPAITWQDQRALEPLSGSETYLSRFVSLAGGPAAFARMGCLPATGYLGPSLFWLQANGQLPQPSRACFIPDAAVSLLTGALAPTDPTDAGSSALFDIVSCQWDSALISRLGLPLELLPPVQETGTWAAPLLPDIAAATDLPAGLPVYNALGDNQASFLGSVREPLESLLVNLGTGAQLSALVTGFQCSLGLDTRYFPGGRYILVGAGLFGGTSYAALRDFFRQVGLAFYPDHNDRDLYEAMNHLAATVSAGADGLCCSPLFSGSRLDPSARGSFTGLTLQNLTPGHITRALLEGIATELDAFRQQMQPLTGTRRFLVGSGNAVRRNPLLVAILATQFGLPLSIPALAEEAATGAALVAAVGAGALPSLDAASQTIGYL